MMLYATFLYQLAITQLRKINYFLSKANKVYENKQFAACVKFISSTSIVCEHFKLMVMKVILQSVFTFYNVWKNKFKKPIFQSKRFTTKCCFKVLLLEIIMQLYLIFNDIILYDTHFLQRQFLHSLIQK